MPTIQGLAAVFDDGTERTQFPIMPGVVEVINTAAFDRTLQNASDVVGLMNHNKDLILGRRSAGTLELHTDRVGLRYSIEAPDTTVGRDTLENVRLGNLNGSSFSFSVVNETWHSDGAGGEVREILEVELHDVGPVLHPAYPSTSATAGEVGQGDSAASGRKKAKKLTHKRQMKVIDDRLAEIGLQARAGPLDGGLADSETVS